MKNSFIALPKLNDSYDGILGMPFLTLANPDVCWKKKLLRWRTDTLTDDQSVFHVSTMHELSSLNTGLVKPGKPKIEVNRYQKFKRKNYQGKKTDILHQLASLNFVSNNVKAEQSDTYLLVNVEEIQSDIELNATESELISDRVETILSSLHPEARRLVEKYKVIFPDELPKCLPPTRDIEHRIDLIDGAQPPQSTIYRMSEHELIEEAN